MLQPGRDDTAAFLNIIIIVINIIIMNIHIFFTFVSKAFLK